MSKFIDKWWAKYLVMPFWLVPAAIVTVYLSQFLTLFLLGSSRSDDGKMLGSVANFVLFVLIGWPLLSFLGSVLTIYSLRQIRSRKSTVGLALLLLLLIPAFYIYWRVFANIGLHF